MHHKRRLGKVWVLRLNNQALHINDTLEYLLI